MVQMETERENKAEPPIKKYQTDWNISELEIFWSSPPICQGLWNPAKATRSTNPTHPGKLWIPENQLTRKCRKIQQQNGRFSQSPVMQKLAFDGEQLKYFSFLSVAAATWWGKSSMSVFLKEQVTKVIRIDVTTYKIWSNNSHLSFSKKKNQITCNCKI